MLATSASSGEPASAEAYSVGVWRCHGRTLSRRACLKPAVGQRFVNADDWVNLESTHGGHWAAGGADIGEDVAIGVLQSMPKCNAQLCDSQEHDQPIEIAFLSYVAERRFLLGRFAELGVSRLASIPTTATCTDPESLALVAWATVFRCSIRRAKSHSSPSTRHVRWR